MTEHRADHGPMVRSAFSRDRLRGLGAVALLLCLTVALVQALRTEEPSRRKALGHVVALQLYASLEAPPSSKLLSPAEDVSDAAPGRPGGYRRAVMFHDPALTCPHGARPVECGAKLEIFRRRSAAIDRTADLAVGSDEMLVRAGALVLRLSSRLPGERQLAYRRAFDAALDDLMSFRRLARLDESR